MNVPKKQGEKPRGNTGKRTGNGLTRLSGNGVNETRKRLTRKPGSGTAETLTD